MARRAFAVGLFVGSLVCLGCASGGGSDGPAAGSDAPDGDGGHLNAGAGGSSGNASAGSSGASGSNGGSGNGGSGNGGSGNGGSGNDGGSGNGGSGNDGGSGNGGSGNGGSGDDGGANDAGVECPLPQDQWLDASALPECDFCENARCVTGNVLTEEQRDLLADCGDGLKCIPDLLLETVGDFLLETCVSLGGAEGRCLSTCVPQVAEQADRLPRDVCADDELCAPCFDPTTGEETGACTQSCDPGPEEDPYLFAECCGGEGLCVPDEIVSDAERPLLGRLSCSSGELCAPSDVAADPSFVAQTCDSLLGAEGRCQLMCLPSVASQADRLPADDCPAAHLCAPCFDPVTGADTGACHVGGDEGPTEEPVVFAGCCDDGDGGQLGSCVPTDLVPEDQLDLIAQDSCSSGELCAPIDIAARTYVPRNCDFPGGAEARCLPACLPDVAERADNLVQSSCEQGELCVPCFDPFTSESTGACELEGDEPEEEPVVFAGCCDDGSGENDLGTCVPEVLVPSDQQDLLGEDTCGEGDLCAPTPLAVGTYEPDVCQSWHGIEGRCLPACLQAVAERADQLQDPATDECDQGALCVPCFDPVTGDDTGACTLEGDEPVVSPPERFDTCCDSGAAGDLGTCVPTAVVPGDQQALLGQDTCGAGDLCAPTPIAAGTYQPDVCQSWLGAEGRCLPECLPDVAARADQLQDPATDDCDQGELCVPCFDPTTGDDTGACTLEGDAPTNETPVEFPACCPTPSPGGANRGTCVPTRAAGEFAESLPVLSCETLTGDADPYVCAPNEKVTVPNEDFPTCTTVFSGPDNCGFNFLCGIARATAAGYIGGKAGVCVPSCVLSEQSNEVVFYGTFAASDLYGQGSCASGEDCAPCNYPEGHPDAGDSTGLCE